MKNAMNTPTQSNATHTYMKRHHYTDSQLAAAWQRDLLNDAKCAREQAESGPFYPDRDITRQSLLAYAAKCEQEAMLPIPAQFAHSMVPAQ